MFSNKSPKSKEKTMPKTQGRSSEKQNMKQQVKQKKPVNSSAEIFTRKTTSMLSLALAKSANISKEDALNIYRKKFLERAANYFKLPTSKTLVEAFVVTDILTENLDFYLNQDKFTFLYELSLIYFASERINDAEKFATKMLEISDQLLSEGEQNATEIKAKQLKSILLLLRIFLERINQNLITTTKLKINELIKKSDLIFKEIPELATSRISILTLSIRIDLTKFKYYSKKDRTLEKFTEINAKLEEAYKHIEADLQTLTQLPNQEEAIKNIENIYYAFAEFHYELASYIQSGNISQKTKLASFSLAKTNIQFFIRLKNFIINHPELNIQVNKEYLSKLDALETSIGKQIASLTAILSTSSTTHSTPCNNLSQQKDSSSTTSSVSCKYEEEIDSEKIETTTTDDDDDDDDDDETLENSLSIDALIEKAKTDLISGDLDSAQDIYSLLLKNQDISIDLQIRILTGAADICNTKAIEYTNQLNLTKRYNDKVALTPDDINNIEDANFYFELGFTYCKKAHELLKMYTKDTEVIADYLLISEEISFNSLKTGQAKLKDKQEVYLKKMEALKESLIKSSQWGPTANGKTDTAIMIKKMEMHAEDTFTLTEKLNEHKTNFSQKKLSSDNTVFQPAFAVSKVPAMPLIHSSLFNFVPMPQTPTLNVQHEQNSSLAPASKVSPPLAENISQTKPQHKI